MGELELVDLYWTSAGPVEVHFGREWSLFDWRDRCAQAVQSNALLARGLHHAAIEIQASLRSGPRVLRQTRRPAAIAPMKMPLATPLGGTGLAPDSVHQYLDAAPQQGTHLLRCGPDRAKRLSSRTILAVICLIWLVLVWNALCADAIRSPMTSAASVAMSPVASLTTSFVSAFR